MSQSTQSLAIEQIISDDDRAAIVAAQRSRKIRTIGVMGVVFALLVAGVAFVAYNIYDIHTASRARVEYEEAYEAYLASVTQLDESLQGVSNTINACRGSVADQGVCENLERQNASGIELSNTKAVKEDIHAKTTDEIRAATQRLREAQSVVDQVREALTAALDPVAQSQVDKVKLELDAAVAEAEKAIAEAQRIVDENKDKVHDESVRQAAIEAIKAVRTQIDGARAVAGADTAAYTAATQSLNQAVEQLKSKTEDVLYSHDVWEQEKREAEARASESARAAEEAARQAQEHPEEHRDQSQSQQGGNANQQQGGNANQQDGGNQQQGGNQEHHTGN